MEVAAFMAQLEKFAPSFLEQNKVDPFNGRN
jgi:hypothetical protein